MTIGTDSRGRSRVYQLDVEGGKKRGDKDEIQVFGLDVWVHRNLLGCSALDIQEET